MGVKRNAGFWWLKLEGGRLLGKHRPRRDDNIKMDLKDIGW
jgi:hypothetical protein